MNKDIFIIILLVLFLGSIGAAVYFAQKGPVIIGEQSGAEVCGDLPLFTGQLGSGSDGPGSFIAQDICYIVFAHENDDVLTCNKIKTPEFKGECYSTLAIKGGDANVCASAPVDAQSKCYSQASEKLGDSNACEKIKSINDRENCISNFASRTGDGSLCKKITNINTRDYCYINTSRNDPSLCNEISSPNIKQDCLRNVGR